MIEGELVQKAERRRAHLAVPEAVDVAIVGSGLGGLMAAAHLAQRGLSVAVFEQHYVAGGCATQFSRGPKKARYHFDVGLHYIGDCERDGSIPSLLRGVGVELEYEQLDPDGFDTLVFPDLEFRMPSDLGVYRDRLAAAFPAERRAIDRYVRLVRATMKATRLLDVSGGRMSLRSALALGLDALRLGRIQSSTMGDVLDGCGVRDPRLRGVLLGQSGDYGLPPSEASAVLHLGLTGHYFRGAYYPRGGGQVIADRLADAVEQAGGGVHLRRGVERILVGSDGAACGVRLEARAGEPSRDVKARVVLSNADLKMTLLRLLGPEHLPASWVERARGFKMAAALFMTFLGVRADLRANGDAPGQLLGLRRLRHGEGVPRRRRRSSPVARGVRHQLVPQGPDERAPPCARRDHQRRGHDDRPRHHRAVGRLDGRGRSVALPRDRRLPRAQGGARGGDGGTPRPPLPRRGARRGLP
jgi:phytoene dehydrogenase-like protein